MKGIAYVRVKVRFELDLSDQEIDDVITNCDYQFDHKLIAGTEIVVIEQF